LLHVDKLKKGEIMSLNKLSAFVAASAFFAASAQATPPISVENVSVECNWGTLTLEAAKEDGKAHGKHAADPSGDGHGPGTLDEPRVGLANVVEQGNLQLLCDLIDSVVNP
jgi:hypothetical protein